jgi:hypothetical protein
MWDKTRDSIARKTGMVKEGDNEVIADEMKTSEV